MKTKLQFSLFTFLLALFTLTVSTDGWGQGTEDFTNLPTNSPTSYSSRTWTGTDNVTWAAEGARTDQTINGKAICWGNSGTRNIVSPTYTGGMGTLTFDYVRAFTGTNARSLEVYVNGVQIGATITVSPTSDVVEQYNEIINVSGNIVLEIRSTGAAQVKVDDISWTAFTGGAPLLSVTPTTITALDYIVGSGPSASQSFDVSGLNLDPAAGNISVTAPANFEVSTDDVTFSSAVNLPYAGGELTATPVYVRLQSGLAINTYSDDVTISGGNATNVTVAVSGEVSPVPTPTLAATPTSLTNLNYMEGSGPSSAQTFVLSGDDLDGTNVTISVPAQFEISIDNVTYSGAVMLPAYDGSNSTIYVRLAAGLLENTYNANADITGGGAVAIAVGLEGNVTPFIAPYTGTGVFELITSVTDLTDGYYVVVESFTNANAMSNNHNGTYLAREAVAPIGNTIVNPGTGIVWLISADGPGHTLYNDVIDKYVSYTGSSNNVQIVDDVDTNNQRWNISYSNDEFIFANTAIATRVLQYNSTATQERFAVYTSSQRKLLLYKYIEVADPVLTAAPTELDGLNYTEGFGPSSSQAFDVSGLNMDGSNVTVSLDVNSDFELSADDVSFSNSVTLTAFNGTATTIHARLKAGLTVGVYDDEVSIGGGGAPMITVDLEGNVIEPFELPYFNGLRNQTDWDQAILDGFTFDGTSFQAAGGGYVRFDIVGGEITSPLIDLSNYNLIVLRFSPATFGSISSPVLSVQLSEDDGDNYTTLETYTPTSSTHSNELLYIDVSAINSIEGRIRFEYTSGSQIRFRDLDMDFYEGYFYMDAVWFPGNPNGLNIPAEDLLVANGETSLTASTTFNSLTVADGAALNVEAAITANGDITNNGSLVFVSNSTTTGQLDTFLGVINGDVEIQRYIPARRAFRLLSSAVNTTGSIRANWQEGANNTGVNFPADNLNPNPGFGTHITGSMTGDNGFDASPSGNPSLFTLNNATQTWEGVDNTDVNTMAAGKAYRLLVRGDRGIDVTSNAATATSTTLRTTGALHTGAFATTDFNQNAGAFNFFGNPYPATVDMNAVLSIATNVNINSYYIWDPNMGTRGAYVTVDLPLGTNSNGSAGNQYLQPGQAAFVSTLANGPAAITFEESHKAVTQPQTQVYSVVSKIDLRLYTASAFAQSENAADAVRIKFDNTHSNGIDPLDALKYYNLDENLATDNNGSLLSIESRDLPLLGETIPLFVDQYRTTDYVFEAHLNEVNDIVTLLKDHFTGTTTELLNNDITLYAFQVDDTNPLSIADDRFEIVFDELLSTGDVSFGNGFVLFPNPTQGGINIATRGIAEQEVQLSITGILGQVVYNNSHTVKANGLLSIDTSGMSNGVYILKLTGADGGQFTTKFIKR